MPQYIGRTVFVFLLLFAMPANAQNSVDSLKAILKNPKLHDTTRLNNIALIIDNLYQNDQVNAYTDLMGKIARKNLADKNNNAVLHRKYTMYLAAYYNNVGLRYEDSRSPKSIYYLDKAIALYQSVEANDEYYSALVSKGLMLYRIKEYKEAIRYYYKSLRYFELHENENADGISYVYSNLAVLYSEQNQFEQSIGFMKKAIAYLDKKTEKVSAEDDLQKFAMLYNIGTSYIAIRNYSEAVRYLNAAMQLSVKHAQNSYTSLTLGKLGYIDMQTNRLEEAEKKMIRANSLAESGTSKASALVKLGEIYFHKKDYQKAKMYLEQGLVISKAINNSELEQQACGLLYQIAKFSGDYKTSVTMLELFHKLEDSAKIEETKNELKQQELKYNYEKKELNYKLVTERKNAEKNNLLLVLSSAIFILLIGAYFFYRNSKQRQAINAYEKSDLKQKLLLTQMNPHFIFNSIDNIQSLIYNKQGKEAVSYLAKFSKLTRQILEHSNENYIALAEELRMIDNYLSIQQLLYNNKFDFRINVAENIDAEALLIPPMLTQPFIENGIKHGFIDKENKGMIAINFNLNNDALLFEITDNGVGFNMTQKANENKSLAMKITKERLRSITNKMDLEVHTQNIFDAHHNIAGAKVFFEIPYIYEK